MTTTEPPTPEARIAGAPISWGVCEVPGWGYQLGPDRVLAEMGQVGLTATELGPDGFLPAQPDAMTRVLDHHGLRAVGGFTPLLLHVAAHDPVPEVERLLQGGRQLLGGVHPPSARAIGLRILHEIRVAEGQAEVREVIDRLLPTDHAIGGVVQDQHDQVQLEPDRGLEFLRVHHEAAVAADREDASLRMQDRRHHG